MTDGEKAANEYVSDRECADRINGDGVYSWDEMNLAYLAGAASRDAEVEALKAKVAEVIPILKKLGRQNVSGQHLLVVGALNILNRPTSPDPQEKP